MAYTSRMHSTSRKPVLAWPAVAALVGALFAAPLHAQSSDQAPVVDPTAASTPGIDPTTIAETDVAHSSRSGVTPLIAPIPFKNSQVGWGLAVMLGAIHRFDPDTTLKPSTGVVGGFYTENKSWGVMAAEVARFGGDAWRVRGVAGHFDVRYDFFGIGEDAGDAARSLPLEQTIDFGLASGLRRVTHGLYVGGSVIWMQSDVELQEEAPPELPPPADEDRARVVMFAPGVQAEYDTRDDDYWPRSGWFGSLRSSFYVDALGATREFQRYVFSWSWYGPLHGRALTLAANANAAGVGGDAPFYMLPSIGAGLYGLRGYTQGRYRDRVMTTVQAELRAHTEGRLGAVVFGGFGQVAPSVSDIGDATVMPAGGLGVRYQLTRNFPMHMRLDYAWGKKESLLYFSVAEAF